MKLKRISLLALVGLVCSVGISLAEDCIMEPVPCVGPETLNGWGCQTGCPPSNPNLGCCSYTEYRVDCEEGPDKFYRTHQCYLPQNCASVVIPKKYQCTHL